MEPLMKAGLTLSAAELLALLEKHFGVAPGKHRLQPRFRFAEGEFGPQGDTSPGIILGMAEITLVPVRSARKRAARTAAHKD